MSKRIFLLLVGLFAVLIWGFGLSSERAEALRGARAGGFAVSARLESSRREEDVPPEWNIEVVEDFDDFDEWLFSLSNRSLVLDSQGLPHRAYGGGSANEHLYYASYDGNTWHVELVDDAPAVGGSASVALDGQDRPHIGYFDDLNHGIKYAYKDALGWHVQVIDGDGKARGYVSVAVDAQGYTHMAYSIGDPYYELRYAYQDENGWHFEVIDDSGSEEVSLALDTQGHPQVSYRRYYGLYYAYRDDEGWHTEMVEEAAEGEEDHIGLTPSLVLDENGYPYISYYDYHGQGNGELKFAHRDESGWHTETVDNEGDVGWCGSLAMDGQGAPHISYYDDTNHDLKYAYQQSNGEWHTEIVDSEGDVGWCTSLVLRSQGEPSIAYVDATHDGWKYAYQNGSGWNTEVVDRNGNVGVGISLALDEQGFAHFGYYFSYARDTKGDLKYAYQDSNGWHTETVDMGGNVGLYPSLTLDSNGNAYISYFDDFNEDLKFAYQGSGEWHIETIDSEGSVGKYSSLALDDSGYPHISYYDEGNRHLKYAYQDASGWHIETVDEENEGGSFSSLALDAQGYPHISYGGSSLKYAYQDAEGWHLETVDEGKSPYMFTSIRLDAQGNPHIGYCECGDEKAMYAYRDAEGWHTEDVSSDGYAGWYLSLALDAMGRPHLSYYRDNYPDASSTLIYAYKDGSDWRTEEVDNEGPFYDYLPLRISRGLAIDDQGRPHIGYYDFFERRLKYAVKTPLFSDVPADFWAANEISLLYQAGITQGCGTDPLRYCPSALVSRAQMAVFLERGIHGANYTPPPVDHSSFNDVGDDFWAKDWIEAFFNDGLTTGCGNGAFCPTSPTTRSEMALFLLRAKYGADYTPPTVAHSRFSDIPDDFWAKDWIEALADEGITSGYSDGTYRPNAFVNRAEMAVFLVRTFDLP